MALTVYRTDRTRAGRGRFAAQAPPPRSAGWRYSQYGTRFAERSVGRVTPACPSLPAPTTSVWVAPSLSGCRSQRRILRRWTLKDILLLDAVADFLRLEAINRHHLGGPPDGK